MSLPAWGVRVEMDTLSCMHTLWPVSYTHLDVYKRQLVWTAWCKRLGDAIEKAGSRPRKASCTCSSPPTTTLLSLIHI